MSARQKGGRPQPLRPRGWTLLTNDKGKAVNCVANAVTVLTCHEEWKGVLAFDELEGAAVTLKVPPWRDSDRAANPKPGVWADTDTTRLRAWMAERYGLVLSKGDADESVNVAAATNVVHPVRDYLSPLPWDGTSRVPTWLSVYCGAPDTPYVRAVSRIALVGAVARIMRPGCKLDTMVVLQGPQGVGKSSAIAALVPNEDWFTDEFSAETRDGKLALRGVWLVEVGELAALRKAEVETIKAFLSRRVDKYRDPYGRRDGRHPRQCALFGTVNPEQYLRDDTGNRRFLPVTVGAIDLAGIRRDRDQLWAEARTLYERGEPWHLTDVAVIAEAQEQQEARRVLDPREEIVARWLAGADKMRNADVRRAARGVTTADVLTRALEVPKERATKAAQMDAAALLDKCGWKKCPNKHTRDGNRVWLYHVADQRCPACAERWAVTPTAAPTRREREREKEVGQVVQVGHNRGITEERGVQPRAGQVGQVGQSRGAGKPAHAAPPDSARFGDVATSPPLTRARGLEKKMRPNGTRACSEQTR